MKDAQNLTSTCTANVTLVDLTDPVALCQPAAIQLDASGNASLTAAQVDNGSSDNCGITMMSVFPNSFTCANVGNNFVTLTVEDAFGGKHSCQTFVDVQDITDPMAVCQDLSVTLDATGNAGITGSQVDGGSFDNCGIASMSVLPNSFTCENVGDNPVTLTVTDVNGNPATCSATVTVVGSADDDCDGVFNECDICPGGDDSVDANGDGIPDCSQVLAYADYSEDWKCSKNKLSICHVDKFGNRSTLCLNKNALLDHLSHGDFAGPCQNCGGQNLVAPVNGGNAIQLNVIQPELSIFPNPASHEVHIVFDRQAPAATLRIMDVLGRVVYEKELGEDVDRLTIDLNNSHFENGIYFISLFEAGELITKSLVVQQ
ncbi:MAG: T9SS type A sorting domain-containing protein [Saprospiraceae bacterium]